MEEANEATDLSLDTTGLSDEELAEAKLLSDNAEVIKKAREDYEEIEIYPAPTSCGGGIVIIAAPKNPKVAHNFINNIGDPKTDKAVETINFAIQCTVYPDRASAKTIYARKPMFGLTVASRAQELSGANIKALGKG